MTEHNKDKAAPLREDVHLLGALLGRVITAAEGPRLFDLEERVRACAKRLRAADAPGLHDELRALLDGLPPGEERMLVRAFSTYFGLVNLAEQQHRVRRRRAYAFERPPQAQPFSLAATLRQLAAEHVPAEAIAAALDGMRIELVLTAHPTEATRASILTKHRAVAAELARLDQEALALSRYRDEVRALATAFSQSSRLQAPPETLLRSIAADEEAMPDYAAAIGEQNRAEPYRRKLSFIWQKLSLALDRLNGVPHPPSADRAAAYRRAGDLLAG